MVLAAGNSGLSWPDVLLGALPNVYVYACNNPSESIIAKRRGYGTIVSHNVPPYGRWVACENASSSSSWHGAASSIERCARNDVHQGLWDPVLSRSYPEAITVPTCLAGVCLPAALLTDECLMPAGQGSISS